MLRTPPAKVSTPKAEASVVAACARRPIAIACLALFQPVSAYAPIAIEDLSELYVLSPIAILCKPLAKALLPTATDFTPADLVSIPAAIDAPPIEVAFSPNAMEVKIRPSPSFARPSILYMAVASLPMAIPFPTMVLEFAPIATLLPQSALALEPMATVFSPDWKVATKPRLLLASWPITTELPAVAIARVPMAIASCTPFDTPPSGLGSTRACEPMAMLRLLRFLLAFMMTFAPEPIASELLVSALAP